MNKIIGLERKSGEYQGNKFDNTFIYYVTDSNPDVMGFKGAVAKVKTSLLSKCTGISANDLGVIINSGITIDYDFSYDPPKPVNISLFDIKK